jgi:hypothetical protein
MNDTTPTPSIPPIDRWWDEFWHFYNGNPDLPLGVGIWCLFYGLALLAILYFISFCCTILVTFMDTFPI